MDGVSLSLSVTVPCLILVFAVGVKAGIEEGGKQTHQFPRHFLHACDPDKACRLNYVIAAMQENLAGSRNPTDYYSLSEDHLRDMCRNVRNLSHCQMDNVRPKCLSETAANYLPVMDAYSAAEQEIMKLCESPSLFTDYQAVVPCVLSLRYLDSTSHPMTQRELMNGVRRCGTKFGLASQSYMNEMQRLEALGLSEKDNATVNTGAVLQGLCCGAEAVTKCGIQLLVGPCSGEAVRVVTKHTKLILDSLKCSEIISQVPCPSTDLPMV